jgi:hypothetical protein
LFAKGDRLDSSSEYTAGASVAYSFPFEASRFEGRLSLAGNYTSGQHSTALGIGRVHSDPIFIARTSFELRAPDHWVATLFVDNINNENRSYSKFILRNVPDFDARLRPRTIGVQLEYRY